MANANPNASGTKSAVGSTANDSVLIAERLKIGDDRYDAKFARPTVAPALSSTLRTKSIASGSDRNTNSPANSKTIPPRAASQSDHARGGRASTAAVIVVTAWGLPAPVLSPSPRVRGHAHA